MADPRNDTGRDAASRQAATVASTLAGPALDLAQGATAFQAASNALKGAALDKLLGPTAVFAGGLIGVLRTMKSIVDQSGILERGLRRIAGLQQIEGKFETLLKSAEAAQKRMQELYRFVSQTPFDLSDVAEGNRLLQALSKGALASADSMKMVGDVAAATGQSFSDVSERVGKLYAALRSGRSLDKVLFQLQMTGIVTDELAKKLEDAEASGASFTQKWTMVTEELKRSEGGMKNELRSLEGLTKQLNNASAAMEIAFGEPFVEAQAKAIENTVKATQNFTPVVRQLAQEFAPILDFTRNIKNSIVDATLATKGMAEAAGVAVTVLKAMMVGGAAAVAASLARNGRGVVGAAMERGRAVRAGQNTQEVASGLATAQSQAADAANALARGELLAAAALKLQSLWTTISTRATALHRVALTAATVATGQFSLGTYAATAAAGVFTGALTVLKAGLLMVGRAIGAATVAMLANPLTAITLAAGAAYVAFEKWASSTAKTNQELIDLIQNTAKSTNAIRQQIKEVKTLDQYRQALNDSYAEEEKLKNQIRELGPAPIVDPTASAATRQGQQEAFAGFREKKSVLEGGIFRLRRDRTGLLNRDIRGLGLSGEEQDFARQQAEGRRSLREAEIQDRIDSADEAERVRLLRERASRFRRSSEQSDLLRMGITRPEAFLRPTDGRTTSPLSDNLLPRTELMRVNDQIAALKGKPIPASLIQQQADLMDMANRGPEFSARALADEQEVKRLEEALRIKTLELSYDRAIAEVRQRGGETATLEAEKELQILKEQLAIAKEKGRAGELDAARIQNDIMKREADQAKARADIGLEREKNRFLANGDARGARALDDARELARLQDQYRSIGLDPNLARQDQLLAFQAQAAQNQKIVADSKQAIGGGGGFAASNPMMAAQQRMEALNQAQTRFLEIIANNTRNPGIQ